MKRRYKEKIGEKEGESNSVTLMKEAAVSAETPELHFILFGAKSQKVAVRAAATVEGRGIARTERGARDEERKC
jgi:hypothetical protein